MSQSSGFVPWVLKSLSRHLDSLDSETRTRVYGNLDEKAKPGNAHLNYEGGIISMVDLLVLGCFENEKINSQLVLKQLIPNQ